MEQLTKEQKERLDTIVAANDLFYEFNKLLEKFGAGDLKLSEFVIQPAVKPNASKAIKSIKATKNFKNVNAIKKIVAANFQDNEEPDFSFYPPKCPHGIDMVQRRIGGRYRWVPGHN